MKSKADVRIVKDTTYIDGDGNKYHLDCAVVIDIGKKSLVDQIEDAITLCEKYKLESEERNDRT